MRVTLGLLVRLVKGGYFTLGLESTRPLPDLDLKNNSQKLSFNKSSVNTYDHEHHCSGPEYKLSLVVSVPVW